jgi:hypothetical protein
LSQKVTDFESGLCRCKNKIVIQYILLPSLTIAQLMGKWAYTRRIL